jgi:hypothetical protein
LVGLALSVTSEAGEPGSAGLSSSNNILTDDPYGSSYCPFLTDQKKASSPTRATIRLKATRTRITFILNDSEWDKNKKIEMRIQRF